MRGHTTTIEYSGEYNCWYNNNVVLSTEFQETSSRRDSFFIYICTFYYFISLFNMIYNELIITHYLIFSFYFYLTVIEPIVTLTMNNLTVSHSLRDKKSFSKRTNSRLSKYELCVLIELMELTGGSYPHSPDR